uniref:Uncharacterized protein n=2 Tax=Stomoxys calcitrans TaxID=35570 RepID=A0A1I8PFD6_STOCA
MKILYYQAQHHHLKMHSTSYASQQHRHHQRIQQQVQEQQEEIHVQQQQQQHHYQQVELVQHNGQNIARNKQIENDLDLDELAYYIKKTREKNKKHKSNNMFSTKMCLRLRKLLYNNNISNSRF